MDKFYKFCAKWCSKCRRLQSHGAKIIDVDDPKNEALIDKYHIQELPTFVVDKGNYFVDIISPETDAEVDIWLKENK